MTSPSRRNRRITAWSTAIATSLLAATASAQTMRPGADQPAPTSWQPFSPTTAPSSPMPAPVVVPSSPPVAVTVPNLPPLPTAVQPPKMVTYEKPAQSTRPVVTPTSRAKEAMPLPPLPAGIADRPTKAKVEAKVEAKPAVMVKTQVPPAAAPTLQPPLNSPVPMARLTGGIPNKEDLFRLDSDRELNDRIQRELREAKALMAAKDLDDARREAAQNPGDKALQDKVADLMSKKPAPDGLYPGYGPLSPPGERYSPKTHTYEPMQLLLEPNYVIHRRLYFEEMNAERAGWDAGPAQSVFSTLYFFRDTLLFPSKIGSGVHDCYDSSAGKCMPGAPTPYYYYPPGITTFGGVVGATIITGTAIILP